MGVERRPFSLVDLVHTVPTMVQAMALYGERKRRELRDAAEDAGVDFWTETLGHDVRYKINYIVEDAVEGNRDLYRSIRAMTLRQLGMANLAGSSTSDQDDIVRAILTGEEDLVLSLIEATDLFIKSGVENGRGADMLDWQRSLGILRNGVRTVLRENRIKFDFVDGQIIRIDYQELHAEVVEPVLRLLHGSEEWAGVERAYQAALEELHEGRPEDAVTDAATALQEALGVYGCKGNTVSKRLNDALKKGVLAPHDKTLADAIGKMGAWVEADRSETGDAHNADEAARDDGWLIVHIVGALILRLSKGPRSA